MPDLTTAAREFLAVWDAIADDEVGDMVSGIALKEAEAALRAALAEDTVCVPVEPTPAMVRAIRDAVSESILWPIDVYRAMLAARPQEEKG